MGISIYHTARGILENPGRFIKRTMSLYQTDLHYKILYETFIEGEYAWLYGKLKPNTTVIDLGAYIGDTAIYFAMNPSVKEVHSYELMPTNFAEAKENIEKSPYRSKIKIFNKVVSDKHEILHVDPSERGTASCNTHVQNRGKKGTNIEIEALPLGAILKGKKNVVIKSDCEGAEATFFDKTDLSSVYAVMLECHNGCHTHVMDVLEKKGFKAILHRPPNKNGNSVVCAYKGK